MAGAESTVRKTVMGFWRSDGHRRDHRDVLGALAGVPIQIARETDDAGVEVVPIPAPTTPAPSAPIPAPTPAPTPIREADGG